ncbi:MAG TPA: mycothiol system anti-sigma-R factor [Thermoanaerobaculia bacterium]|nr:mycothiol system anti-sigma-R factor [Thermoanaerobaculia bacterium]
MDCQHASEAVYRFLDRELDSESLSDFSEHLDRCGHCAGRVAYTRRLLLLVRQRCVRHAAPPQLRERILVTLRTTVLGVLVLALLASAAAAFAQESITLRGLGGETLSEADLNRGATIVVVWASWSPRGRDIDGRVRAIAQRWGGQARVVTVNFQEDRATVESFLSGKNLGAPVFLDEDGRFAKKNAVTNLPALLVMRDGRVAFRGKLPDDPDEVLTQALG